MATLTVKNLPDEIYIRLTKTAKKHRRSINNEAIVLLEKGLEDARPDLEAAVDRIRNTRAELTRKGVLLTDEILEMAKNEGRP